MSCSKQLSINRFKLPIELICIIKDYCFNITEAQTRKRKAINVSALNSRFDGSRRYNNCEHWYVSVYNNKYLTYYNYESPVYRYCRANMEQIYVQSEIWMSATNCSLCGNYIDANTFINSKYIYIPIENLLQKIKCRCGERHI
jgi:hypothetical protein